MIVFFHMKPLQRSLLLFTDVSTQPSMPLEKYSLLAMESPLEMVSVRFTPGFLLELFCCGRPFSTNILISSIIFALLKVSSWAYFTLKSVRRPSVARVFSINPTSLVAVCWSFQFFEQSCCPTLWLICTAKIPCDVQQNMKLVLMTSS